VVLSADSLFSAFRYVAISFIILSNASPFAPLYFGLFLGPFSPVQ
jgi:hypothetical protein